MAEIKFSSIPLNLTKKSQRLRISIRGAVQGVGFRPFVYRLAQSMRLRGFIQNTSFGVLIEAEGGLSKLENFLKLLESKKPALSFIQSLECSYLDERGYEDFRITESDAAGQKSALILPDIATCPECLKEIFNPKDRRYFYPFTNCTHCGPRYSIMRQIPYDRANTSMKKFTLCSLCQVEYQDPHNRRFHAEPNACPVCGPKVELWDETGRIIQADTRGAISAAVQMILEGKILALKGLGGFQLLCDATNEVAVRKLRYKKHREEKPFAIMCPTMAAVKRLVKISSLEECLLASPESPIVLLEKKRSSLVAASVAPNNPYLGVMLPYTGLHHILMRAIARPIVATSGNLSDEPMVIDEDLAVERLNFIAEGFLVHNRPILRAVDDSIARIIHGRQMILRRARGYAPLPISIGSDGPSILATGAHLKNTLSVSAARDVFLSQHIGDLETEDAYQAFRKTAQDLESLLEIQPQIAAHDLHPDYLSTRFAKKQGIPTIGIQHHYAHVLSAMAENDLEGAALGIVWDGTGYGTDGSVWGGEILAVSETTFERVGALRSFALPGKESAIREPRRSALGLLYEIFKEDLFSRKDLSLLSHFAPEELTVMAQILSLGSGSVRTTSMGRLFDAVAAILNIRQIHRFEGQAAMELEYAATLSTKKTKTAYPVTITDQIAKDAEPRWVFDWEPMMRRLITDLKLKVPVGVIAQKFHHTLVEAALEFVKRQSERRVVLSGGCFQNRYLLEYMIRRLKEEGYAPYWHQRVPPNDGGIVLGQTVAVLRACK